MDARCGSHNECDGAEERGAGRGIRLEKPRPVLKMREVIAESFQEVGGGRG